MISPKKTLFSNALKKFQRVIEHSETNKIPFERIEDLSSDSRIPMEVTPIPPLVLQPRILNFEIVASSERQTRDVIQSHAPIFTDGATPNMGGIISPCLGVCIQ